MKPKLEKSQLSVRSSPIHGYGVFADEDIAIDTVIEECSALTLQTKEELRDYTFNLDSKIGLLLGYGSLYNHSNQPNAAYQYFPEFKTMVFTARKSIKKDEEIFIYYGHDWFSSRDAVVIEPSFRFKLRQFFPLFSMALRVACVVGGFWLLVYYLR